MAWLHDVTRDAVRHFAWGVGDNNPLWFDVIPLGTQLSAKAQITSSCLRPSERVSLSAGAPERRYKDEELADIEQATLSESRRGAQTRYWENTDTGERLDTLTKGPISIMDIVAWCAGALGVPGYLDDAGYLHFVGRQAHWVRVRGENVSAFEVEKMLTGHPKLVDWCRERLAYFKVPRYIEFVDEFPRTITKQEIARHELRKRGVGGAWDRDHAASGEGRTS